MERIGPAASRPVSQLPSPVHSASPVLLHQIVNLQHEGPTLPPRSASLPWHPVTRNNGEKPWTKQRDFGTQVILSFHVKHGETRMNDNQPCLRPCSWKTRHGNRLLGCFWVGSIWTYVALRIHKKNNFQIWCDFSQSNWMKQLWCKPGSLHCISSRANAAGCWDIAFFWVLWGSVERGKSEPSLFASQLQQATATATVSFPKDQRIAPSTTSHQCNGKCHFSRNVSKKLKTQD